MKKIFEMGSQEKLNSRKMNNCQFCFGPNNKIVEENTKNKKQKHVGPTLVGRIYL